MKEATRYRITGTLFLVALGIIFLPMLFDGAGLSGTTLAPLDVSVTATVAPPPPLEDALVEQVDALAAEIDGDGFRQGSATRLGEPVLRPAPSTPAAEEPQLGAISPGTNAWAVQLGSFSNPKNARELREKLRRDGYEAFLSTIKSGDAVHTRVAVGPFLSREEAASRQAELSSRYQVRARLMDFST